MALLSSASTIAGLVDAMINAADALMKHQGQAAKVRTKATRTTIITLPSSRPIGSVGSGSRSAMMRTFHSRQHNHVQLIKQGSALLANPSKDLGTTQFSFVGVALSMRAIETQTPIVEADCGWD